MLNRTTSSFSSITRWGMGARALCTRSTGIWRRPSTLERELLVADAEALDPIYKILMNEVRDYDRLFKEVPRHPWWRRKSGLEVLALLLVHDGEKYHAFRGSNIEPSTPTGSLCAERLSIGRAVCDLPHIKRSDFRAIAVWCPGELDDDEDTRTPINPIAPCGVCGEWLKKIVEESEQFFIVTFTSTSLETMIVTYNHEETEITKYKGERKCMVCGRFPIIVSTKTSGICDCELKEYNAMSDSSRQVLDFLMGRKKRVTVEGMVSRIRDHGLEQLFCKPLFPNVPHDEQELIKKEEIKRQELHEELDSLWAQLHDVDKNSEDWKALKQRLGKLKGKRMKQKQLKKVQLEKNRLIALEKQWPTSLLLEKVEAIVEDLHSHPFPLIEKGMRKKKNGTKEVLKLTELGRLLQEWKLKGKRFELLNQT